MTVIRSAKPDDADAIWRVIEPVLRAGETYAFDRDWPSQDALAYWMGDDKSCFVAEVDGEVLGTYYLRTNYGGGGAHVCNCGYMVAAEARGQGLASAMCQHSLEEARRQGFRAMQFNFVVSTNEGAIRLWQRHGFTIVGTQPKAFDHPTKGLVDAYVMHREL
jgi:ribosomal protein S18 acetylase RimI-like enzyme